MDKINFQNLPSTTTPVNATNLNLLQTNIENTLNTYSTNEMRIGTWINNKPVYRKVIDCGNLPNNDYKSVAHNISNFGVLVNLRLTVSSGISQYISNMKGTNLMYSGGATVARVTSENIQIATDANFTSHTAIAIIEYTKTTD